MENKYMDGPCVDAYIDELKDFLEKDTKAIEVVVMPDFFMDRLITLNQDIEQFTSIITDKIRRKGGSIDQIPQIDQKGGNAINVASALSALEAKVTPIISTNEFGLKQIQHQFRSSNFDITHIKIGPKASITTALEFTSNKNKANVMLRDVGSLADFGPENLNEDDYKLIETADYVCIFNWAGTRQYGTQLASTVFSYSKSKGKAKNYFDTADPLPNKEKILELIDTVLKSDNVDILSLNENEAVSYASFLSQEIRANQSITDFNELALLSARVLAKQFRARIDLHTTTFSASLSAKYEHRVPSFNVNALRATGAGDAWNAGKILGDAN
ncbi:MAG: carbohydrate kinase family protein, partial [Crenarchaeota archaeon]|nr:carbohydrate kinase family protein [Thermoproteota archaeon]